MLHVLCCFAQQKLSLLWRSRHRGRCTTHLKLPETCGSRLLHGSYCWKVIHFIVAISSFPERKTSNRGSESYLAPIMWTKYLSVLTIISTENASTFVSTRFSNCGETHKLDIVVEAEKLSFLLSSFLEHLTEPQLIFCSISTLKMWRRSLLSWVWV